MPAALEPARPNPPAVGGLDRGDVLCLLGAVLLFAGLWLWFGLGVALTVVGALALTLGVLVELLGNDIGEQDPTPSGGG
ncbi:MAG TPA: hypothetical protein VM677_17855 [Actinokineospora sp.]|jgi:hypothetical protein|nr:hypothetical protein [Actinokineospora sp.]